MVTGESKRGFERHVLMNMEGGWKNRREMRRINESSVSVRPIRADKEQTYVEQIKSRRTWWSLSAEMYATRRQGCVSTRYSEIERDKTVNNASVVDAER